MNKRSLLKTIGLAPAAACAGVALPATNALAWQVSSLVLGRATVSLNGPWASDSIANGPWPTSEGITFGNLQVSQRGGTVAVRESHQIGGDLFPASIHFHLDQPDR